jgi:outer membrane protein
MKIFLPVLVGLALSLQSFSQPVLKIAHVDVNEIMAALPEKDSADVKLEKERNDLSSTYDEMTVVYNKLYNDYQKGLSGYSDVVRKTKEDELLDKQKRISEFEQDAAATLQKRNVELYQPIYEKIMRAIDKVATEGGYSYVLDLSKGSVVFKSKESTNLNPAVLKILKP